MNRKNVDSPAVVVDTEVAVAPDTAEELVVELADME